MYGIYFSNSEANFTRCIRIIILPSKDATMPNQKMQTANFAWTKDADSKFCLGKRCQKHLLMTYVMVPSYLTMYVLLCNLLNASCGVP